jgi:hypothetical protein
LCFVIDKTKQNTKIKKIKQWSTETMICAMQKLSKEQHEVLVGILLGDANLQTESQGRTYRLRVTQVEQNREYLFALYEIFKPLVTTPPRLDSFVDSRTNRTYKTTMLPFRRAAVLQG